MGTTCGPSRTGEWSGTEDVDIEDYDEDSLLSNSSRRKWKALLSALLFAISHIMFFDLIDSTFVDRLRRDTQGI